MVGSIPPRGANNMPFWRTVTTSNGTEEKIWTFSARELQPGDILISEYNTRLITKVVPYTEFGDEYTAVVHSVSMTNMKQTSVALVFFMRTR